MFKMNKRGENILYENLTYFLIIVIFFSLLFVFVSKSGSGLGTYENVYAKKIALMIDMTKPDSKITLDISDIVNFALKNGVNENNIDSVISFDNIGKQVTVKLGSGSSGYNHKFFSNVNIENKQIENQGGKYVLKMEVKHG